MPPKIMDRGVDERWSLLLLVKNACAVHRNTRRVTVQIKIPCISLDFEGSRGISGFVVGDNTYGSYGILMLLAKEELN